MKEFMKELVLLVCSLLLVAVVYMITIPLRIVDFLNQK